MGHNISFCLFSKERLAQELIKAKYLLPFTTKQIQEQTNFQPSESHFSLRMSLFEDVHFQIL